MYPKNYFFGITRDGIDGRQSLLVRDKSNRPKSNKAGTGDKRQQTPNPPKAPLLAETSLEKVKGTAPDVDMEDLSQAVSALQFVPSSIRFGRGGRKGGFAKK
jgi:hypothetical protein